MSFDVICNHVNTFKKKIEEPVVETKTEEKVEEVKVVEEKKPENNVQEDLFKLTKDAQIKKLEELGLTKSEIKKLNTEIKRVNKIIELTGGK